MFKIFLEVRHQLLFRVCPSGPCNHNIHVTLLDLAFLGTLGLFCSSLAPPAPQGVIFSQPLFYALVELIFFTPVPCLKAAPNAISGDFWPVFHPPFVPVVGASARPGRDQHWKWLGRNWHLYNGCYVNDCTALGNKLRERIFHASEPGMGREVFLWRGFTRIEI